MHILLVPAVTRASYAHVFAVLWQFSLLGVQIRIELLSLTNTAKFNGSSAGNAVDLSSFGRITSQRGFMRIWQISFRYAF